MQPLTVPFAGLQQPLLGALARFLLLFVLTGGRDLLGFCGACGASISFAESSWARWWYRWLAHASLTVVVLERDNRVFVGLLEGGRCPEPRRQRCQWGWMGRCASLVSAV